MDPMERLLAERECERLIYRYCHLIDHGEAAKVCELFTDDGVWASPEVTRDGKDKIAKAFRARQENTARMSRHVCSTPMIDIEDAETAKGVTYLQLYRHDGEPGRRFSPLDNLPEFVAEYHDVFARTPDGWRFKSRKFVGAFARAQAQT
jgi:ketosteroid isomerase-like protein